MERESAAARAELRETPEKRTPEGMRALLARAPDGVVLRAALAMPRGRARGTVLLLQGLGEYVERHYELIADLLRRHLAVLTFDWRGQGLSQRLLRDRRKVHARSFAEYDMDMETVVRRLLFPDCPPPYFAIGISMGGHMLLRASWRHVWFERGVLVSPMVRIRPPRLPEGFWRGFLRLGHLAGLSSLFFPGVRQRLVSPDDFADNPLTSDSERFAREARFLAMHPDVGVAGPSIGWVRAALASIDEFSAWVEAGGEPRWPMLALAARRDALVDSEATWNLARKVGGISCVFLHQARHDINMERDDARALFLEALEHCFLSSDESTARKSAAA